jgi:hypothetical protein
MVSRHGQSTLPTVPPSSSQALSSQQSRPSYQRHNSGRSALRSAEQQLRDIREGDTSWQRTHLGLFYGSPSPRKSISSSTADTLHDQTDHPKKEPTVRVYLHHVRKTDTLPLILLAYELSAPTLRKANRLWPTDSIQSRKKLYLPVEECGIEPEPCLPAPKPCDSPNDTEPMDIKDRHRSYREQKEWPPRPVDQPVHLQDKDGQEGVLEEWVMVPAIGPTQIISLPAHKLSHFPSQQHNSVDLSASLPTLDALCTEDQVPRDSMDSVISRSSLGRLVEDGVARIVRVWHETQGKKKWAQIGKDLIEL